MVVSGPAYTDFSSVALGWETVTGLLGLKETSVKCLAHAWPMSAIKIHKYYFYLGGPNNEEQLSLGNLTSFGITENQIEIKIARPHHKYNLSPLF